jgi:hypothetical protein
MRHEPFKRVNQTLIARGKNSLDAEAKNLDDMMLGWGRVSIELIHPIQKGEIGRNDAPALRITAFVQVQRCPVRMILPSFLFSDTR